MSQHVAWCFTAYGPWVEPNDNIAYLCYQFEICPKTGKKHQQGYLEFHTKRTLNGVKKLIGKNVHLEPRRGTQQQAIDYCKKPKPIEIKDYPDDCFKFFEFGLPCKQGKRTDLVEYKNCVLSGATEKDLMETHFETWVRHPHLKSRIMSATYEHAPKPAPFVWVLNGSAGSGKSTIAHLICGYLELKPYTLTGNYKWWDGYNNSLSIIMDDYDGQLHSKDLLQLLDRYCCKREVKGGTVYITSPLIFITCNDKDWITADPKATAPISRRLSLVSDL